MPTFNNHTEIKRIYYFDSNGNHHEIKKAYNVNGSHRELVFSAAEPSHEYVHTALAKKRLRANVFGDLTPQNYDAFFPPYISVTPGQHIYLRAVMGMWAQSVSDVSGYVLFEWCDSSKKTISQVKQEPIPPKPIFPSPLPGGQFPPEWSMDQKYDYIEANVHQSIIDEIYKVPSNAAYVRLGFHLTRGSGDYAAGQGTEYLIEGVVADIEEPYSCGYTNKSEYAALFPKEELYNENYPKYD